MAEMDADTPQGHFLGPEAPAWLTLAEAHTLEQVRTGLDRLATALGHSCTVWTHSEGTWSASGPASGTPPERLAEALAHEDPVSAPSGWLFAVSGSDGDGGVVVEFREREHPTSYGMAQAAQAHARAAWRRARHIQELRELTTIDDVSGLFNARQLREMLATEVSRCRRHRRPMTLLFLDLDHFKAINDALGLGAGNEVLRQVGSAIRENLRRSDHAFRYGDDEFAVVLTETPPEVAHVVVDRLRDAVTNYARDFDDARRQLGVSIGVASYPENGEQVDDLMVAADQAMYRAKQGAGDPDTGDLTLDMGNLPSVETGSLGEHRAPSVLLLDVMSTLVTEPFELAVPAFFDMTLEELFAAKDPAAWIEFEYGRIDEDEYCRRFFVDRRPVDRDAFKAAMRDHYDWMPGVEELLTELKERGVRMYALSNYSPWYQMIDDKLGLSRFLSWDFVSCRTGLRKPAPEAYTRVLEVLDVDPPECAFVDDRAKNVAAAEAVGMVGILRRPDIGSLRRSLRDVGFLVLPGDTGDLRTP